MPVKEGAYPTILAYSDMHDLSGVEDQDVLQVPVVGTIGQSAVERAFCRLAHERVNGGDPAPENCSNLHHGDCALTGYHSQCLSAEPEAREWRMIEQSVALADE